jgi:hypothetical protein
LPSAIDTTWKQACPYPGETIDKNYIAWGNLGYRMKIVDLVRGTTLEYWMVTLLRVL